MANITITNVDTGGIELHSGEFEDGLLTFGGADTFVKGTILARDSSTKKWIVFVKGGSTNGNGVPRAVLTYEVSKDGSGDLKIRALVAGTVNKNRLVIDADGDGSNVDENVIDGLKDNKITCTDVTQLGEVDNPQPGADS
jgi:hypothetical protein